MQHECSWMCSVTNATQAAYAARAVFVCMWHVMNAVNNEYVLNVARICTVTNATQAAYAARGVFVRMRHVTNAIGREFIANVAEYVLP